MYSTRFVPSLPSSNASTDLVTDLVQRGAFELRVWYRFTRRDLPVVVLPCLLMTLAALRSTGETNTVIWARTLMGGFGFFALCLYGFCLINQISGVEQDALDKPDRPIPSGLVSIAHAKLRWAWVMVLYPLVGFGLGGIRLTILALLTQLLFLAHEQGGMHRHWFTKNLCCAVGLFLMLTGAFSMVTELTSHAWRWILFATISFGLTLPLQDLRDVEGDRRAGRFSLSMSIGDAAVRGVLAALIAVLPLASVFVLFAPRGGSGSSITYAVVLGLMNVVTAIRTVVRRGREADHATYMLHTFWFSALLAGAAVFA